MTQIIEIEGSLIRVIDKRVTHEASIKDILPHLVQQQPVFLPSAPRTQVAAYYDPRNSHGKKIFFLCELPPQTRSIIKSARRYRLSMPWTFFWFSASTSDDINSTRWSLDDYYVFHSLRRYTGPNTRFISALLPNVYANGRICFGSTGADPNQALADRIDQLVNDWYLTRFNSDLDGERPKPFEASTYREWVDGTRTNPNYWQTWPEFNTQPQITILDLLQNAAVDRASLPMDMSATGVIAEVPRPFTIGRAEEYFTNNFTPEERTRLRMALDLNADNPDFFVPIETITTTNTADVDDGGEPVTA
jgi:Prokaryotic E2 family D